MDSKMRKMAELQLSVVSDPKNRKAIENQVVFIHVFSLIAHVTQQKSEFGCKLMVVMFLTPPGEVVSVASHFKYSVAALL